MGANVVEINGDDYYYPSDRKEDLYFTDDGFLVNVSSSSITLYSEFVTYGDNSSGYPRIVIPAMTRAYIRSSSSSSNYQTLRVSSYDFKSQYFGYSVYLLVLILGVLICQLFKR